MIDFVGIHEITNSKLNKLCMDELDLMLNAIVRCKHGIWLTCKLHGWSQIREEDFGLTPTMVYIFCIVFCCHFIFKLC